MNSRAISPELREAVLKRDKYTCRHCGSTAGPFVMDHVYPYVKGGETTLRNLVTSCRLCNSRKHSRVGVWPKPIGHFTQRKKPKNNILAILGAIVLLASSFLMALGGGPFAYYSLLAGVLISFLGFYAFS